MAGFLRIRTAFSGGLIAGVIGSGLLAVCFGCTTSTSQFSSSHDRTGSPEIGSDTSIAAQLAHLARRELSRNETTHESTRDAVGLPPGVDPDALRESDNAKSGLDLNTVMRQLNVDELARRAEVAAESNRGAEAEAAPDAETQLDAVTRREATRHYTRGRAARLDKQELIALNELRQALQLDSESTAIMRELARTYLVMGRPARAVGHYSAILEREPDDSEARFRIGLVFAERRNFKQAAAVFSYAWRDDAAGGVRFNHDPAADLIVYDALFRALREMGYDRAATEAGARAAAVSPAVAGRSSYQGRLGVVYRQRGEIWRSVGDAYCRLGEFENALQAYSKAASLPLPDPGALFPRVVYANLRLGRVYGAQNELLRALQARDGHIADREIHLCQYLADEAPPTDTLAQAVTELYRDHDSAAAYARASAALLSPTDAQSLLREFIGRRPRDVAVVAELLLWMSEQDMLAALALATDLVKHHPDLAGQYVQRFVGAAPRTIEYLDHLQQLPQSPARAVLEARLLVGVEALGPAWDVGQHALQLWPDHEQILLLNVQLAAALGEPQLVEVASRRAAGIKTGWAGVVRALAALDVEDVDTAIALASDALRFSDHRYEAYSALAEAHLFLMDLAEDETTRTNYAELAVEAAEQAVGLDPTRDVAYEILIRLHRPNGILADASRFRAATSQLLSSVPDSRLYAFMAAQEAVTQQRYDSGLDRLLNLYQSDVTDDRSLRLIIATWVLTGREDDAARWLEETRRQRPGDIAVLSQWVAIMLRQGRVDDIVAALEPIVAAEPLNHAAARLLRRAFMERGDMDEAVRLDEARLLSRPIGIRRENGLSSMYVRAGQWSAALPHLEWVLAFPDVTLDYLMSSLAIAESIQEADANVHRIRLALALTIIDRFPTSSFQPYASALVNLVHLGQADERFDDLIRMAIESAPGASDPERVSVNRWHVLAQILTDADAIGSAARLLRGRLYAVAPLDDDARSMLVWAAIAADAAEEGNVGRTLELLHDLDTRAELPVTARTGEPVSLVDAIFEASNTYATVGDRSGSEHLLRKVLAQDAAQAMAKNNLGYMRLVSGGVLTGEEETMILQAHEASPEDSSVLDTVGWLRYMQGQFGDVGEGNPDEYARGALSLIRDSIARTDDPSGEVLDHLGDTLFRSGNIDAAVKSWQTAITVIEDPRRRSIRIRSLLLIQREGWGLVVGDPKAMYDREHQGLLDNARAKIRAVEEGQTPSVTPTFAEIEQRNTEQE